MLDASLAALLTGIREAAGVTQVKLARRLDQPQSLVAKIETCTSRISAVELLLVCRAPGCDAGRLRADLDAAAQGRAKHGALARGGAGEGSGPRIAPKRSPAVTRMGRTGQS